jgi:hypothetical protein
MRLRYWSMMWMMSTILILTGAIGGGRTAAAADIPDQDVARIEAAMPEAPTVLPRKARTLLIFSLC